MSAHNSIRTQGPTHMRGFRTNRLKSDGHLITEDSVLPTTAPGGAPEQNRCYQTPAYFYLFSPLRPLRSRARRTSHRSLRYAPAGGWRGLITALLAYGPANSVARFVRPRLRGVFLSCSGNRSK